MGPYFIDDRENIPQARSWPQQCPARYRCRWQSSEPRRSAPSRPIAPEKNTFSNLSNAFVSHMVHGTSTHVGGEVLQREGLNSVDAELRVGLDNGKASRNYQSSQWSVEHPAIIAFPVFSSISVDPESGHVRKNFLLPPFSSMISTTPGFSCSMDGTWFARTPISPVSAGMLT